MTTEFASSVRSKGDDQRSAATDENGDADGIGVRSQFLPGKLLDGRYEVLDTIGQGGFGAVLLARDKLRAEEKVAVKVVEDTSGVAENFLVREFSVLRDLRHPNLVRVFELGKLPQGGGSYVTMELVRGVPFDEALEGASTESVLRLFRQVLDGLAYLHASGYVHLDLKPSNILVETSANGRSHAKILDLGFATRVGSSPGTRGSPAYMPPELIRDLPVGREADLYSLGVILHQVVYDRLPFEGSPQEVLHAHLHELPPKLQSVHNDPRLTAVISRFLEKIPARRPASATAARRLIDDRSETSADDGPSDWGPFVEGIAAAGRDNELETLLRLAFNESDGQPTPHLILIEGPPGVGRTRLLRELVVNCALREQTPVMVTCTRGESLNDAIANGILSRGSSDLRDRANDPALGPNLLTRVLNAGILTTSVVVAVDDLHLADARSRRSLVQALSLPDCPLRVFATVRSDSSEAAAIAEITTRRDWVERMRLRPFNKESIAAYLRAVFSGAADRHSDVIDQLGTWLQNTTGGNPLHLRESLLEALEGGQILFDIDSGSLVVEFDRLVGTSAGRLLLNRVHRLAGSGGVLIGLMATAPAPVHPRALALAADLTLYEVLEILRSLEFSGLVFRSEGGLVSVPGTLSEVWLLSSSAQRTRKLHQRWLYVPRGELGEAVWAHHMLGAGSDRIEAAQVLARCAEVESQAGLYEPAIGHLRTAIHVLEECQQDGQTLPGSVRLERLNMTLGKIAWSLSNFEEAITALTRALELVGPDDPSTAGSCLSGRAEAYRSSGQLNSARLDYLAAIEVLKSASEPAECGKVLCAYSFMLREMGSTAEALDLAIDGWNLLKEHGSAGDLVKAGHDLGNVLRDVGDANGAERCFRASIEAFESKQSPFSPWGIASMSGLALLLADRGELDPALDLQKKALSLATRFRVVVGTETISYHIGDLLGRMGKPAEGIGYLKQSLALASRLGDIRRSSRCLDRLADLARADGRLRAAIEYLTALLERLDEYPELAAQGHEVLAQIGSILAEMDAGDRQQFRDELRQRWPHHDWDATRVPAVPTREVIEDVPAQTDANQLTEFVTKLFDPESGVTELLTHVATGIKEASGAALAVAAIFDDESLISGIQWSNTDQAPPQRMLGTGLPLDYGPIFDDPWRQVDLGDIPGLWSSVRNVLPQVSSLALAPVRHQGGLVGAILLAGLTEVRRELQPLPDLEGYLRIAALGMEEHRRRGRQSERISWLEKINALARTSFATLSLEDLLEQFLSEILALMGGDEAFFLRDDSSIWVHVDETGVQHVGGRVSSRVIEECATRNVPIVLVDIGAVPQLMAAPSIRATGVRSVMCAPVSISGERIGFVYVSSRLVRREFQRVDLGLLERLIDQVTLAIDNARLVESMAAHMEEAFRQQESVAAFRRDEFMDVLTGLYARSRLMDLLERHFSLAVRFQRRLTCAVLDLDNFKLVNDQYGHLIGDAVLHEVAQGLRRGLRPTDVVGRFGGEEFLVLLPNTSLRQAVIVTERLRQLVAETEIPTPGGFSLRITVTVGLAELRPGITDSRMLLDMADRALLHGKASGKNCVNYYSGGRCIGVVDPTASSAAEADRFEPTEPEPAAASTEPEELSGMFPGIGGFDPHAHYEPIEGLEDCSDELSRSLTEDGPLIVLYLSASALTENLHGEHIKDKEMFNRCLGSTLRSAGEQLAGPRSTVATFGSTTAGLLLFLHSEKQHRARTSFDAELIAQRVTKYLREMLRRCVSVSIPDEAMVLGCSIALPSPHRAPLRNLLRAIREAEAFRNREVDRFRRARVLSFRKLLAERSVRLLYQPIVDASTGQVFGYEALARGPFRSELESAPALFREAALSDMLVELDQICQERAVLRARGLPSDALLFINVSSEMVECKEVSFQSLLPLAKEARIRPDQIVLELNEWNEARRLSQLAGTVAELRGMGIKVALDDVGSGNAGFAPVFGIKPDFIKLDRRLCSGVSEVNVKRRILEALVTSANEIGAQVIAEGIEHREDLDVVRSQGVELFQGFLFARPGPAFPSIDVTALEPTDDTQED